MPTNPQKPPDNEAVAGYHSTSEVMAAIEGLTEDEHKKLAIIAALFHKRRPFRGIHDADDILQEAVFRTLTGRKRWRRGVSIIKHLDRAMENISGHRRHEDSMTTSALAIIANRQDPVRIDLRLMEREAQRAELRKVQDWFSGDRRALDVLALKAIGMSRSETLQELGISQKDYETISRRILRTLTKQAKGDEQ